jgi:hypothetical protein
VIWVELISGKTALERMGDHPALCPFPGDRPIFLELFEIDRVLVCVGHVASGIVNANRSIM